jgi:hypothetical protein
VNRNVRARHKLRAGAGWLRARALAGAGGRAEARALAAATRTSRHEDLAYRYHGLAKMDFRGMT